MNGREIIKSLFISYPTIYGGSIIATWFCCIIYAPDSVFSLEYFQWMFLFALLGDLPSVIFYSRKELTEKQWTIRLSIHFIVVEIILLIVGYYLQLYENLKEGIIFAFSVFIIYIIVKLIYFTRDFIEANRINKQLKKIKK